MLSGTLEVTWELSGIKRVHKCYHASSYPALSFKVIYSEVSMLRSYLGPVKWEFGSYFEQ